MCKYTYVSASKQGLKIDAPISLPPFHPPFLPPSLPPSVPAIIPRFLRQKLGQRPRRRLGHSHVLLHQQLNQQARCLLPHTLVLDIGRRARKSLDGLDPNGELGLFVSAIDQARVQVGVSGNSAGAGAAASGVSGGVQVGEATQSA